ncbi:MAG: hypothetical protein U0517_01485 [Candidatus Andersenbacteria bacterium]
MHYFVSRFLAWIPLGLAIILVTGLLYATVQQVYRRSADDPQVQIVQELARDLAAGQDPTALDAGKKLDLTETSAPFVILYDKDGKVMASTVTLNNNPAIVPSGALHETDNGQQNRITWQPQDGVREALVIEHYKTQDGKAEGYIVVGRSLKEIEAREADLMTMLALGLGVTLITTLVASLLVGKLQKPKNSATTAA